MVGHFDTTNAKLFIAHVKERTLWTFGSFCDEQRFVAFLTFFEDWLSSRATENKVLVQHPITGDNTPKTTPEGKSRINPVRTQVQDDGEYSDADPGL